MGSTPSKNRLHVRAVHWMSGADSHDGIAVSTRIRLARNIAGICFPATASSEEKCQVWRQTLDAITAVDCLDNAYPLKLSDVDKTTTKVLLERHLISRDMSEEGGVVVSSDEVCSVMVNEEDHIRVQVLSPGCRLAQTWSLVNKLDDELGQNLRYAYSSNLGFLTSCPTNVGTGMRASVMLHLPALVLSNRITAVLNAVRALGHVARGYSGEGTQSLGNLFQVSNQSTLGESESQILDGLERVVSRLIEHEKNARASLLEHNLSSVCDYVGRAYGTLRHAYSLDSEEALTHLSALRLGIELGMFSDLSVETINDLWIMVQVGHLQKNAKRELKKYERQIRRAELVRDRLIA